ncbi:MAG: hypothetical protein LBJ04_06305 [Sphingobacterium sp.]|jgi:hypothetical protein|uniref:hypothetical protein n=1 Tax=Sphingobacterium sp. TaxID=341027 RepID=UPI002817E023|nr:hypothetical protein [Sphingobacterium sp.]MDR0262820.1 hypothetical protein [Sphingobacterium sp.]
MEYFPLLKHRSDEIIKFIANCGIFSLLLNNGKVIHFIPDDPDHFIEWLNRKGIKNIKGQQSNVAKEKTDPALNK